MTDICDEVELFYQSKLFFFPNRNWWAHDEDRAGCGLAPSPGKII